MHGRIETMREACERKGEKQNKTRKSSVRRSDIQKREGVPREANQRGERRGQGAPMTEREREREDTYAMV